MKDEAKLIEAELMEIDFFTSPQTNGWMLPILSLHINCQNIVPNNLLLKMSTNRSICVNEKSTY